MQPDLELMLVNLLPMHYFTDRSMQQICKSGCSVRSMVLILCLMYGVSPYFVVAVLQCHGTECREPLRPANKT